MTYERNIQPENLAAFNKALECSLGIRVVATWERSELDENGTRVLYYKYYLESDDVRDFFDLGFNYCLAILDADNALKPLEY